ncbi:YjeF N-terminal domain-like protein [Patellaria atrata CBS 101060]|uniref:Enhancer of mRNA-decapping protein 3 n=1 Tax=Patellaria atrata CBS 101060 TaxID=1346257 RepID=A0A9P4SAU0_9PEZI|nr:YjeF N-terminal domain-like protein [Patellaria atrata CBS 101060]
MASSFIGMTVIVTLKVPPNTVIQGLVANVLQESQTLMLRNVIFLNTGHHLDSYNVEGAQIADLKLETDIPPAIPSLSRPNIVQNHEGYSPQPSHPQYRQESIALSPASIPPRPPQGPYRHETIALRPASIPPPPASHTIPLPGTPKPTQKQKFVDPAILSFGKKPTPVAAPTRPPPPPQEVPSTPIKLMASAAAVPLPPNTSPFVGVPRRPSNAGSVKRKGDPQATLTAPFSGLNVRDDEDVLDDSDDPTVLDGPVRRASITKTRTGKPMETPIKPTSSGKKKKRGKNRSETVDETSPDVTRKNTNVNGTVRGKGWRQTPLLQDNSPKTPGIIGGKVGLQAVVSSNRKSRRQKAIDAQNGWATEDATDIQELPEFDFAENLSKFDKRSVFDQIRNEDTTADEERLVSFNRLPTRPGTYGGKNLHPTENVLEKSSGRRTSEYTSSENDFSELDSGRNSRRAMSRASAKRNTHRQNSLNEEPRTTTHLIRSFSRAPAYASSQISGSPVPGRPTPPESPFLDANARHSSFRVLSDNSMCPTITPGGMTAVEELAEIEFGLTEEIMAENSGRGIAEVALRAINPGGRRLARENLAMNAKPVVVVLAGNHRAGARAIAGARHLHARGIRIMVCMLGYERSADWDKDLRRQVELFRKFGGLVKGWGAISTHLKKLEAPPELIVDALLGRGKEFDALGEADQAVVVEVVGWANKSRAHVLAVEGPSGSHPVTGESSILEGEPLEIRAKFIVCCGAPRVGLVRALQAGEGQGWQIWVADIGINRPWRKERSKAVGKGAGIRFGDSWVVQVGWDGMGVAAAGS